jgi:hypothetical protein
MSTKIEGRYSGQGNRLVFRDPANSNETVLPIADVVFMDDFLGQAVNSTHNWTVVDVAGGTPALLEDGAGGIYNLPLTNTNEKQDSGIYQNDKRNWVLNQGVVAEFRVSPLVLPTDQAELYFGLCGDYVEGPIAEADAGPLEHMFFCFDGSGAIKIFTDDTATDNDAVATGVTLLATEWAVCRIDCATITDVKFYINGSAVATGTTFNMSTAAALKLQPHVIAHKETGTGVGTLYVDYVRIWQNRS